MVRAHAVMLLLAASCAALDFLTVTGAVEFLTHSALPGAM